jgi:hypothetical protein
MRSDNQLFFSSFHFEEMQVNAAVAAIRDQRAIMKLVMTGGVILGLWASAFSEPLIQVDEANADAGVFKEGAVEVVEHEFTVRNTGDDTLVIQRVKPG